MCLRLESLSLVTPSVEFLHALGRLPGVYLLAVLLKPQENCVTTTQLVFQIKLSKSYWT